MDKKSPNTFSLADVSGIFFFDGILKWVIGIKMFHSTSHSFFRSQLESLFGESTLPFETKFSGVTTHKLHVDNNGDDEKLGSEDVKMVMGTLNIIFNSEGDMFQEKLGLDEMSAVFEEEEPSLEEVKEAFDVFDVNRDGYVDATELQRVLNILGLREGSDVTECKKMIRIFDENQDGYIDFNEFVKLMENSFC